MGYSRDEGYTPASFETLMNEVRNGVNTQFGTSYTPETFQGTGFYRFFYPLIQRLLVNDIKTSEIFLKLQDYFAMMNLKISRPVATRQGLIDALWTYGIRASIKPIVAGEAGKLYVAVDLDEDDDTFDDDADDVFEVLKNSTVAGIITQGTHTKTFVLSNGQSFDFSFNLPNRIDTLVRVTVATSHNNQYVIDTPDMIRDKVLANIRKYYWLGKNFEPQRYLTLSEAPYAESILFEYSIDDGVTWQSTIYQADYDDLIVVNLEEIVIVQV